MPSKEASHTDDDGILHNVSLSKRKKHQFSLLRMCPSDFFPAKKSRQLFFLPKDEAWGQFHKSKVKSKITPGGIFQNFS